MLLHFHFVKQLYQILHLINHHSLEYLVDLNIQIVMLNMLMLKQT